MKKVYYSFHDVPTSGNDHFRTSLQKGFRFSKKEIIHITIAMIVLTFAFSFALVPGYPL